MPDQNEEFQSLLDSIRFSVASDDSATDKDSLPEETLKGKWEDEVHAELKKRYSNDTKARVWLAGSTQVIIFLWMVAVVVILMGNRCFELPPSVLIAMLGTTTATVIGLAYIVLKGFFSVMKQDVDLRDHQLKK